MESDSQVLYLVIVIVCLIMSGFFSASETALTSLGELKVKHLLSDKKRAAKVLELWLLNPNKVLNTILIGNNIVNILGSVLFAKLVELYIHDGSIAAATGMMTFLVLIFGEITPKTFAKHNAEKLAIVFLHVLKLFYAVFYPFTWSLNKFVKLLIKTMGGSTDALGPKITADEIEFLINMGEKEGVLENQKREMLSNIFEISETLTKEVMVPRTDMVAIPVDIDSEELMQVIRTTEYSRIPVYAERLDNVVGILYVKDILKHMKGDISSINVEKVMRKASFVPETKRIDELLKEFQQKRVHIAMVIDEYGGVAGLVSMEDILEEIVGEIWDEYDKARQSVVHVDDATVIVDARLDIDDFCEEFDMERSEEMEEYETVGGLVYDIAGKIPEEGEEYLFGDFRVRVLEKDERTLRKIEFKRVAEQEASGE